MEWLWIKKLNILFLLCLGLHSTQCLPPGNDSTIDDSRPLCPPCDILQPYTLTSQFQEFPVTWEAVAGSVNYTLGQCSYHTGCRYGNIFFYYNWHLVINGNTANLTYDGSGIISYWHHSPLPPLLDIYCNKVLVCSSLEFFLRPSQVDCSFKQTGDEVELTCESSYMYPEGKCSLSPSNVHGWQLSVNESINTRHPYYHWIDWNEYYMTTCRYKFSITSTPAGSYPLSVTVYPDIRDGMTFGVESNTIYLNISDPVTTLAPNCSDTSQFALISCSCAVPPDLFPPATPVWFYSSGQQVEDSMTTVSAHEVVLSVPYKPHEPNQTFECRGNSTLGLQDPGLVFKPQFYFPSNQDMDFYTGNGRDRFNLCPGAPLLRVHCKLNGNPDSILYLNHLEDPTIPTVTAKGSIVDEFAPVLTSDILLTCRTEDASSRFVYGEKQLHIHVIAPPLLAPNITINGFTFGGMEEDRVNVTKGDPFNVICQVDGGIPKVNSVTLSCGKIAVSQTGRNASILLDALTHRVDNCSCTADHDSGCYNLTTEVFIDVHEGGFIESVSLYGIANPLTLCPGQDEFSITCNASVTGTLSDLVVRAYYDYNPSQSLVMTDNVTDSLGDTRRYTFSLSPPIAGGNHTLICLAGYTTLDGYVVSKEDKISLLVYEPPPNSPTLKINGAVFSDGDNNAMVTVTEGQALNVSCWVDGGYPDVSQVTLSCGQFAYTNRTGNVIHQENIPYNTSQSMGQSCSCVASHPSGCYVGNTWTVYLEIKVPQKEYEIVVNKTKSVTSVVEPGSKIEISCDLSGNYSRNDLVLISGFGPAQTIETSQNETGVLIQEANCESSGRYICPQSDYSETDPSSYVDIFVECELKPPDDVFGDDYQKDTIKPVEANEDGAVTLPPIKLLGYPDPIVSIDRESQGRESTRLTETEYMYVSDRTQHSPPAVIITVTLTDGQQKSGTSSGPPKGTNDYAVTLSNGRGQPYTLKVRVVRPGGESDEASIYLIAGVSLGCAIVAVLVGITAICWRRRKKLKKQRQAKERKMSYSALNPVFKKDQLSADTDYAQAIPDDGRASSSSPKDGRRLPVQDGKVDDILGPLPSISKHSIFDERPPAYMKNKRPSLQETPSPCDDRARRPSLPDIPLEGSIFSLYARAIPNSDQLSSLFATTTVAASSDGLSTLAIENEEISSRKGARKPSVPSMPITKDVNRLIMASRSALDEKRRPSTPAVFLTNPAYIERDRRPSLPQNTLLLASARFPALHTQFDPRREYLTPVKAEHRIPNGDDKPELMRGNVSVTQDNQDFDDRDGSPYQHVDPDYDSDDNDDGDDNDSEDDTYRHLDPDYDDEEDDAE